MSCKLCKSVTKFRVSSITLLFLKQHFMEDIIIRMCESKLNWKFFANFFLYKINEILTETFGLYVSLTLTF